MAGFLIVCWYCIVYLVYGTSFFRKKKPYVLNTHLSRSSSTPFGKRFIILLQFLPWIAWVYNDLRLIEASTFDTKISIVAISLFYSFLFVSLFTILRNKTKVVRVTAEIITFSALYTDSLYLLLGDYPFSFDDSLNLWNNTEYASGSLSTFATSFLLAFLMAGLGFALLKVSFGTFSASYSPKWAILFVVIQTIMLLISSYVFNLSNFLPAFYRVPSNVITGAMSSYKPQRHWEREAVKESSTNNRVNHIFLVVDESITGTALSINGFPLSTTPFLEKKNDQLINFGIASSYTNYSAGSNLALLVGLRTKELRDTTYTSFYKSNLYQYAKKAGYITYWLDGQAEGDKLQNYTTHLDLADVDSLYQPANLYPSLALYGRDSLLAEKMAMIAKSNQPTFVYVNKSGAHWPYGTNFPHDSLAKQFSTSSLKKGELEYLKSIYWNVDLFWKRLLTNLPDCSHTLIVYTSDHGENYTSASYKTKHASIYKTEAIEGLVPLIVLDKAHFFSPQFSPSTHQYSHSNLFPTLLLAMGYGETFVSTHYGKSLKDKPQMEDRVFQTGDLFGRGTNHTIHVERQ